MSAQHRERPAPARRRRGAVAWALAVVAAATSLEGDRPVHAGLAGELARVVPSGALAFLESDDLPALVATWRDCEVRRAVTGTDVYSRCTASRLGLRLAERRELFEAALAEPVTLERLAALPGNLGGIALYNVGETTFVMWLRTHHGAAADLDVLAADLPVERRGAEGQTYVVHRGGEDSSPAAFAVVGDLLIVSNDVATFERALALARSGGGEGALAADQGYAALAAGAPASARAHLYLDLGRLVQTRQFRRYWVHDNVAELEGIERAMLSVTFEDSATVEHRQISYRPGANRLPAGPEGPLDAARRRAALPDAPYAALRSVDVDGALAAAGWMWPAAPQPDGSIPADPRLREILERGGARQILEVIRLRLGRDGFAPADQLAVAIALASPDAVSTDDVLSAGVAAMGRIVAGAEAVPTVPRRTHARGVTVHTIAAPLPGLQDLEVSRSPDGRVLVLATTAALAAELASAAAATLTLGGALAAAGPDVARVDLDATRNVLSPRLDLITTTGAARRSGAAAFLGEDVPELLDVPNVAFVERSAHRSGARDVQVVRYVASD